MKLYASILAVAALLPACAPTVQGGPALPLPPELAETSRVASLTMSSDWLRTDRDFAETFTEEVMEELSRCATGARPLHLRIHVDGLDRAGRLDMLVGGEGSHRLTATAELVDRSRDGEIVGRYPLTVNVDAGGRIAGLIGDREMVAAEGFGRALCEAAFARNPRRPGPWNATP